MPADPRTSLGARLERKAVMAHLRRLTAIGAKISPEAYDAMQGLKVWILKRQSRYDKAKGGLGK